MQNCMSDAKLCITLIVRNDKLDAKQMRNEKIRKCVTMRNEISSAKKCETGLMQNMQKLCEIDLVSNDYCIDVDIFSANPAHGSDQIYFCGREYYPPLPPVLKSTYLKSTEFWPVPLIIFITISVHRA